MKTTSTSFVMIAAAISFLVSDGLAETPVGTAFMFQGQLKEQEMLANGTFPMKFRLYSYDTCYPSGDPQAPLAEDGPISVTVEDGLFTVKLDFESTSFFDGNALWIEVEVNGSILCPRLEVTPTPYAHYAMDGAGTGTGDLMLPYFASVIYAGPALHVMNESDGPDSAGRFEGTGDYAIGLEGIAAAAEQATGVFGSAEASQSSYGLHGKAPGTAGAHYGVFGQGHYGVFGDGYYGVYGKGDFYGVYGTGVPYGVYGAHEEAGHNGYLGGLNHGVCGRAYGATSVPEGQPTYGASGYNSGSDSWTAYGVYGESDGQSGYGVYGKHTGSGAYAYLGGSDYALYAYNSGGNAARLVGDVIFGGGDFTLDSSVSSAAILRIAQGGNPQWRWSYRPWEPDEYGLYNEILEQYAITFRKDTNRVGINNQNPQSALDVNGRTTTHVLEITGGADLAEPFTVGEATEASVNIGPGMVVIIDPDNAGRLMLATEPYDRKVAGVISGANGLEPGMVMSAEGSDLTEGEHPVALTGRVWCWCDAQTGSIRPGDLLTTSDTPGHAMKVSHFAKAQGAVLGKAMTSLDSGLGLVLVLVSLQ